MLPETRREGEKEDNKNMDWDKEYATDVSILVRSSQQYYSSNTCKSFGLKDHKCNWCDSELNSFYTGPVLNNCEIADAMDMMIESNNW